MAFLKFLYRMLRDQKARLIAIVLLMALVALMEGLTVALLVPLLNFVIGQGSALPGPLGSVSGIVKDVLGFFHLGVSLVVVLVLIVIAFIVQSLFRLLMTHVQTRMLANYEFSLIHRVFSGYFSSSWGFFVLSRAGQLVNTLITETDRAYSAYKNTMDFLSSFLIAFFYIILSLLLSWQLTLGMIVLSLVASLALRKFMQLSHKYGVDTSSVNNEIQAYAFDKIGAAKLLKSSASEKSATDQMDAIARRRVDLRYRSIMSGAFVQTFYQPMAMAVLALVAFVALEVLKLSPAVILVFTYIFFRLTPYFSSLQLFYQQVAYYLPSINVIDKTLETAKSMAEVKGGREIKSFTQGITFKDVSFSYQEGMQILNHVNLTIKKGESVAIIGESGVGKTTLIDLLLGLFTPTSGQILVDGLPLHEYDPASWRRLIGHMTQDTFLFHDTVEANLKWMTPRATREKVEAAARAAYAHDFIAEMENDYNSVVGDRGMKLSGGQRQRLALARMILQDPQIVILDEATSALDAESEAKVQESIEKLVVNKTLIVISHRASMLRNVDRVYIFKSGTVTEVNKTSNL